MPSRLRRCPFARRSRSSRRSGRTRWPRPALGGYSASKAAAYSVTQALRPQLKAKRIELLAVLPGPIDTDMVKALPIPKTSPADTARGVLAGIARGDEEIFPDPMAQQMGALWNKCHKVFQ